MRNILLAFFVFCTVCFMPVMAIEAAGQSINISQAQDTLSQSGISEKDQITFKGMSVTNRDSYYTFSTQTGSEYYVNTRTGTVERVDNPFNWNQTQNVNLDVLEAEKAAMAVVNKYSGETNRSGLKIVRSQLMDHGAFKEYTIEFSEIVNGATLPNAARVSINPSNGALITYMSMNEKVSISLKPNLSEDEVMKIAGDQYPGIHVVSQESNLEIAYPAQNTQRLVYRIILIGEPINDMMYGGFLAIDAHDGKVWYNSPFK